MSAISTYEEATVMDNIVSVRVEKNIALVKQIAYHLSARLPKSVQVDDLIQSGIIGLIEAAQRYDENKAANFKTFASIRIRGAMLDELRKNSWMPSSVHQNMRQISSAIHSIENKTGQEAKPQDIAEEMGVELDEYHHMLQAAQANELYSFEDVNQECYASEFIDGEPYAVVEKQDLKAHLAGLIKELPEREQMVLALYYTETLNFKEIGQILAVSEARICQLHAQALARLKARARSSE